MPEPTTARTIEITRTFDAPRTLVFQAWVDPKHLMHWYHAGGGWTTPYAESDARPGGAIRIGFAPPAGEEGGFDFEATYDEIVEPERIAFTIGDGRPVTVTFADDGGKTKLTLVLALEDENTAEMQRQGWTEMFINLGSYLAEAA